MFTFCICNLYSHVLVNSTNQFINNEAVNRIELISIPFEEMVGKTDVAMISLILVYIVSVKMKRLYIKIRH